MQAPLLTGQQVQEALAVLGFLHPQTMLFLMPFQVLHQ
jgi:hypothetical protein